MHELGQFFITYGYLLAAPIMIIEGPLATMVMAALASHGYFNVVAVFFLGFCADLVSDFVYYKIGKNGAPRVISYINQKFTEQFILKIKDRFQGHGGKLIFTSKVLPGVTVPVFITAGLARYPLTKLYKFAIPAGIIWSSLLTILGYYFGMYVSSAEKMLSRTGIVLAVLVIIFILYQYVFGRQFVKRLFFKDK